MPVEHDEASLLVCSFDENIVVSKVYARLKQHGVEPTLLQVAASTSSLRNFEEDFGNKRVTVIFIFDKDLASDSRFASSREIQEDLMRLFRWCRAHDQSKFIVVLDETAIGQLLMLSAFFDQEDIQIVSTNFLKKDAMIELVVGEVFQSMGIFGV